MVEISALIRVWTWNHSRLFSAVWLSDLLQNFQVIGYDQKSCLDSDRISIVVLIQSMVTQRNICIIKLVSTRTETHWDKLLVKIIIFHSPYQCIYVPSRIMYNLREDSLHVHGISVDSERCWTTGWVAIYQQILSLIAFLIILSSLTPIDNHRNDNQYSSILENRPINS